MASIIWLSVFLLLILELFVTFLLVLPLPKFLRHFLAKKIFSYHIAEKIRFFANFIFLGLIFAVADAVSSLRHLTQKEETSSEGGSTYPDGPAGYINTSLDKQRKFRAERNMYLAGFALTLGFVITRLIELIQRVVKGEEQQSMLQKRIDALEAMSHTTAVTNDTSVAEDTTAPVTDISSDPSALPDTLRQRANAAVADSDANGDVGTKED